MTQSWGLKTPNTGTGTHCPPTGTHPSGPEPDVDPANRVPERPRQTEPLDLALRVLRIGISFWEHAAVRSIGIPVRRRRHFLAISWLRRLLFRLKFVRRR